MINPVGTLKTDIENGQTSYKLERGVYSFPSIGDSVIIPKDEQLKSIVENSDEGAFVKIGTAPIAGNAVVRINPDKLFGRHIAVLGNTGSGKSCSAAGLIRWSLEAAKSQMADKNKKINCRFIILDPNGEYTSCFDDLNADIKRFKIEISAEENEKFKQLKVPGWMWNSYEWASFSHASSKTQKPILRKALRELKHGTREALDNEILIIPKYFNSCLITLRNDLSLGFKAFGDKANRGEFGKKLQNFAQHANSFLGRGDADLDNALAELENALKSIYEKHYRSFVPPGQKDPVYYFESLLSD